MSLDDLTRAAEFRRLLSKIHEPGASAEMPIEDIRKNLQQMGFDTNGVKAAINEMLANALASSLPESTGQAPTAPAEHPDLMADVSAATKDTVRQASDSIGSVFRWFLGQCQPVERRFAMVMGESDGLFPNMSRAVKFPEALAALVPWAKELEIWRLDVPLPNGGASYRVRVVQNASRSSSNVALPSADHLVVTLLGDTGQRREQTLRPSQRSATFVDFPLDWSMLHIEVRL